MPAPSKSRRFPGFAGLGLDFRVERGLAVHPQFTLVRTLREGDERTIYTAGLGFRFMMAKRDPPPAASRSDRAAHRH